MGKNAFEEMDPDLKAMRASMRPSAGSVRWSRVLTGMLVIACLTFAFAFYMPLARSHEALIKQFSLLQTQIEAANRSVQEARAQATELRESKQALEERLEQPKQLEKARADASVALKSSLETKLTKPISKEQVAIGIAEGQPVVMLTLNYVLSRGKLELSADGKAALCGVASADSKKGIRVLAIADKKSIPPTLATKLKTPLEYGGAVAALAAQALLDKCSVEASRLRGASFSSDLAASPAVDGKKLASARLELWLESAK
jgi:hypothetical protein